MTIKIHLHLKSKEKNFEGLEAAVLSKTEDVVGGRIGLITEGKSTKGFEFGGLGLTKKSYGALFNLFSFRDESYGFEIGLINYSNQNKGLRIGVMNFSALDGSGFDAGVLGGHKNYNGLDLEALMSRVDLQLNGVQIAPICYANNGDYLQLGLITIRGKGTGKPWYKRVSPLVGYNKK